MERYIITPYFIDRPVPELANLARPDWTINDPGLDGDDQQSRASGLHRPLADFVVDAAVTGDRPVSIMGDCCATIGVMAGLQRAGVEPTLLWFDAHGDFNTWETTPSGFLGGMPLAMIVGLGDLTMNRAVGLEPIPSSRVLLCDGRDLDPGERDLLDASDVTLVGDPQPCLRDLYPTGQSMFISILTSSIPKKPPRKPILRRADRRRTTSRKCSPISQHRVRWSRYR